jgi:hypothetical protein
LLNDFGETGFVDREVRGVPGIDLLLREVDYADTDL